MRRYPRVTRISAYHWYLASPYWQVRRREALKRANYLCQECGQRATQVHHLTYVGVFNESPSDLVALCARCHADLHHKTPANDNQITMFPIFTKDKTGQK